jgi:hypothetical protein
VKAVPAVVAGCTAFAGTAVAGLTGMVTDPVPAPCADFCFTSADLTASIAATQKWLPESMPCRTLPLPHASGQLVAALGCCTGEEEDRKVQLMLLPCDVAGEATGGAAAAAFATCSASTATLNTVTLSAVL